MSDLVSRKDAINAIYHHFPEMAMSECANVLHEVPPAQPISESDLIELRDRYGDEVRFVVEDMLSGEGKRWMI